VSGVSGVSQGFVVVKLNFFSFTSSQFVSGFFEINTTFQVYVVHEFNHLNSFQNIFKSLEFSIVI